MARGTSAKETTITPVNLASSDIVGNFTVVMILIIRAILVFNIDSH